MDPLGQSFKNSIAKWCYVRVKKIKIPFKLKKKRIKQHKFDAGKLQLTLFTMVDKIDQIINSIDGYASLNALNNLEGDLEQHTNTTIDQGAHGGNPSDRRLKYDVNIVGKSLSGLNIYTFRFKDSTKYGGDLYQGVMSDEVPKSVVTQNKNGYDLVDYSKIDVNFARINKL